MVFSGAMELLSSIPPWFQRHRYFHSSILEPGRRICVMAKHPFGQVMRMGIVHSVVFDASRFSSGMYFYRLETWKSFLVKKLMLLK